MPQDVFFYGFGEAGQAIAQGLRGTAGRIAAYDLKLDGEDGAAVRAAMTGLGVVPAVPGDLAAADLVFCLVTADQAVAAARAAAGVLAKGALWCDGNSCAPGSKRQAAALIEAAGGRYVDMAIMAPVYPKGHRTPVLISGPHGEAALGLLRALGMQVTLAGPAVGEASSIKMLRSVIIKGMEALTAEAFLAARRAGVEEAVIASLQASDPGFQWRERGAYNLERMLVHGARRAAEMGEVAASLRELGLPDRMARAAQDWQAELAALHLAPGADDLGARADLILARMP